MLDNIKPLEACMSAIPVVTFGAVVFLAVCAIFIKRNVAASIKMAMSPTEGPPTIVELLTALISGWTSFSTTNTYRRKGGTGSVSLESTANIIVKLIPPIMHVVVSIAFAAVGFWIVFSQQFPPEERKWGYTTLGTILGYWLK